MPRKADQQYMAFVMTIFAVAGAVLSLGAIVILIRGCWNG